MNTLEDTRLDESILDDECGCGFNHRRSVCTIEVTHIIVSCVSSTLVCTSAAKWQAEKVPLSGNLCRACSRPADLCWKIRPI